MSPKAPRLTGRQLIKLLAKHGFEVSRTSTRTVNPKYSGIQASCCMKALGIDELPVPVISHFVEIHPQPLPGVLHGVEQFILEEKVSPGTFVENPAKCRRIKVNRDRGKLLVAGRGDE